jgi:hypothetical protein
MNFFFVYMHIFYNTLSNRFAKFVPKEKATSFATTFCTYVKGSEIIIIIVYY